MINNRQPYGGFYSNAPVAPPAVAAPVESPSVVPASELGSQQFPITPAPAASAPAVTAPVTSNASTTQPAAAVRESPPPIPVKKPASKVRTEAQSEELFNKQVQDVKDWYNRTFGTTTPPTANEPAPVNPNPPPSASPNAPATSNSVKPISADEVFKQLNKPLK